MCKDVCRAGMSCLVTDQRGNTSKKSCWEVLAAPDECHALLGVMVRQMVAFWSCSSATLGPYHGAAGRKLFRDSHSPCRSWQACLVLLV